MATRFLPVLTDLPDLKPAPHGGTRKNPLTDKESASLIRDARRERGLSRTYERAKNRKMAAFTRGRSSGLKRAVVMHGSKRAFAAAEKFSPWRKAARKNPASVDRYLYRALRDAAKAAVKGDTDTEEYELQNAREIVEHARKQGRTLVVPPGLPVHSRHMRELGLRSNPVGKTKRGKRGGWVSKSGQGKFEHKRVRPPDHFVKGSLKTVPWAFITEPGERAFVLKKVGRVPDGAKVITGHIKSTVTAGRVAGKRVKWLGTGVQAVLLPLKLAGRAHPRFRRRSLTDAEVIEDLTNVVRSRARGWRKSAAQLRRMQARAGVRKNPISAAAARAIVVMRHGEPTKGDGEALVRQLKTDPGSLYDYVAKALPGEVGGMSRSKFIKEAPGLIDDLAHSHRKNPGRLIILNPADGSDPIALTAKGMTPANRALLERIVHAASSAEVAKLRHALVTYKKFHGCWPPSIAKHHAVDGKQNRFLVGLGKADHVGYRINKEYPGSNKKGTPFRHHFSSGQDLATNEEGKGLAVLDRPGARRGTETTDWIRG
jgi:hypothetical protein